MYISRGLRTQTNDETFTLRFQLRHNLFQEQPVSGCSTQFFIFFHSVSLTADATVSCELLRN